MKSLGIDTHFSGDFALRRINASHLLGGGKTLLIGNKPELTRNKNGVIRISPLSIKDNLQLNTLAEKVLTQQGLTGVHERLLRALSHPDFSALGGEIDLTGFHSLASVPSIWYEEKHKINSLGIAGYYEGLVDSILQSRIFGKNTRSKFGSLRKISLEKMPRTVYDLVKRIMENIKCLDNSEYVEIFHKLVILLKYTEFREHEPLSLGDELSGSFGTSYFFSVSGETLDIAFIPKNYSYIESGNNFGDCTSLNKNLQVDESKNIFWTTASWLFDPFYQILQIESHGQPIMKIHLVLMQFKGKIILCIDAIETVPSMREFKTNQEREGVENQGRSHFFEHRYSIMEQSMQVIYALAERLGIDTVLAEEYSNTTWVRKYLSRYEQVIFDMSELCQLFDGDVLEYILRNEGLDVGGINTEIQLRNTELQDKGFKPHLNSGRLLKGSIKSVPNGWRGI